MEKVRIKAVHDSGKKTRDGHPMITVELDDGRKCTAYTNEALTWIGEIEVEVKLGQKINDIQYYNLFKPQSAAKNKFQQRDYTFEKKNASLQRAIETAALVKSNVTSKDILVIANKYYEYLNSR